MARFWNRRIGFTGYDAEKLVRMQWRPHVPTAASGAHLICDIDKTYLETKFESVIDLVSVAFESADEKITVSGAKDVLLAARWGDINAPQEQGYPRGLHFVSSSPPQLRPTLERKLLLDALDWDSDTFKDQAYNIMKGRVSLLKNHVGYKTLAILNIVRSRENEEFVLIGDNAEYDLYIYLGICLFSHGVLSRESFLDYIATATDDDDTLRALRESCEKPVSSRIRGILIRNAPGYRTPTVAGFTDCIGLFDNYWQATLALTHLDMIDPDLLPQMALRFHNQHLFTLPVILRDTTWAIEQGLSDPEHLIADGIDASIGFTKGGPAATPDQQNIQLPAYIRSADDLNTNAEQAIANARAWLARRHELRSEPTR